MRKVIGLALAAAFALAASASARSDAVAVIDPKSAAEFVLNTCLPAMDDLQKVAVMVRENNWFPLQSGRTRGRACPARLSGRNRALRAAVIAFCGIVPKTSTLPDFSGARARA
jgi:hypothetical protein